MRKRKRDGEAPAAPANPALSGADAETRSLAQRAEVQALMAESERAIAEGRTQPAAEVFRRQREHRARTTVG